MQIHDLWACFHFNIISCYTSIITDANNSDYRSKILFVCAKIVCEFNTVYFYVTTVINTKAIKC